MQFAGGLQGRPRVYPRTAPSLRRTPHSSQPFPATPREPSQLDADAIDLEDRAEHLSNVFEALSVYLAVILDDTAQNIPGKLDLPDVEAHLADLAADVAGLIERAAEDMRGWIA